MRTTLLLIAMTTLHTAFAQPPILQITIERIEPGGEAEYARVEELLKETCVRLHCPNAYLALESVGAPKEIWWLVTYDSQGDVERVAAEYAANEPLLNEMAALTALKKDIAAAQASLMTRRQGDAAAWGIGAEPFAVIATGVSASGVPVFESEDGALFAIAGAASRTDAEASAARLGPSARIFTIRPEWSKPEASWVDANPRFWNR